MYVYSPFGGGPPYHEGGSVWHWGALRGRALLFCVGWPAFLAAGVLYIHVYIYMCLYIHCIYYILYSSVCILV